MGVHVVGFSADADVWCYGCAELRYGHDDLDRVDREGNPVHPIFSTGEYATEICAGCGEGID